MKLTTEVAFPTPEFNLTHRHRTVLMGSCFSENIGQWLSGLQFLAGANPTGIIYNPISIARHIVHSLSGNTVDRETLQLSHGLWVHTDFHSSFAHPDKEVARAGMQQSRENLGRELRGANALFITFGTAVVFNYKESNETVNNCHRLDSRRFEQAMADIPPMAEAMGAALRQLQTVNSEINIFLTVSPVRHLRHGAVQNQRSKARLILLCEQLCAMLPRCTYLPVYELAMDELRDYRYYRHDDLIHLNDAGLSLLKNRLKEVLFDKETLALVEQIERWQRLMLHDVLHPDTEEARAFLQKREADTNVLSGQLGRPLILPIPKRSWALRDAET